MRPVVKFSAYYTRDHYRIKIKWPVPKHWYGETLIYVALLVQCFECMVYIPSSKQKSRKGLNPVILYVLK